MDFLQRNIAITDVETGGPWPHTHEILEIGLVIAKQPGLEIVDIWSRKVKPEFPDRVTAEAIAINGYNAKEWERALSLRSAMQIYSTKTKDCVFTAHNVTFDWAFIEEAFRKTLFPNRMDYHRIDLLSIAWMKLRNRGLTRFNLDALCEYLGIPKEPMPHRATTGALTEYKVLRKLLSM